MRRAAGAVSLLTGLGFGLPCAFGIRHFARTGEVWTFMGFPTYGDGPFELAYWIGFALPFGPVLGIARTGLLLAARGRRAAY